MNTVCVFTPLLKQTGRKPKSNDMRLAKGCCLELLASDSMIHGLEGNTESTHAYSGKAIRSTPNGIVAREENWRAFVEVLKSCS